MWASHQATVHLTGAGTDTSSVFHVKDVHVKVASLKFSIRDSKHDALYKVLRPLATGVVKKQVQRALRDAIRTAMELVDEQLVKVRDRMEEAKASEDTTRTQALKDVRNVGYRIVSDSRVALRSCSSASRTMRVPRRRRSRRSATASSKSSPRRCVLALPSAES